MTIEPQKPNYLDTAQVPTLSAESTFWNELSKIGDDELRTEAHEAIKKAVRAAAQATVEGQTKKRNEAKKAEIIAAMKAELAKPENRDLGDMAKFKIRQRYDRMLTEQTAQPDSRPPGDWNDIALGIIRKAVRKYQDKPTGEQKRMLAEYEGKCLERRGDIYYQGLLKQEYRKKGLRFPGDPPEEKPEKPLSKDDQSRQDLLLEGYKKEVAPFRGRAEAIQICKRKWRNLGCKI